MNSRIVGALYPVGNTADFFESKPFPIPYFDNKELKIGFVEAEHQPYLDTADQVFENFLKLNSLDKMEGSDMVFDYYSEVLKKVYTDRLPIKKPKYIWNFVIPNEIIIHWDEVGDFYLCVLCECAWEQEHGLQLVFKNGKILTRASGDDGHFTD